MEFLKIFPAVTIFFLNIYFPEKQKEKVNKYPEEFSAADKENLPAIKTLHMDFWIQEAKQ